MNRLELSRHWWKAAKEIPHLGTAFADLTDGGYAIHYGWTLIPTEEVISHQPKKEQDACRLYIQKLTSTFTNTWKEREAEVLRTEQSHEERPDEGIITDPIDSSDMPTADIDLDKLDPLEKAQVSE